jgi:hypothetical protein
MEPDSFVRALGTIVLDGTVPGLLQHIREPPGRKPPDWLVELSAWMNSLDDEAQTILVKIVEMAAVEGAGSLLAVLDGSMSFDESRPPGELELSYVRQGERKWLNDYDALSLEDSFTSLWKDRRGI